MAEEELKKKGRLATAVLAGSALAFGSFAFGIPAALAQGEDEEEVQQSAATSPEPENTESGSSPEPTDAENTESPESADDDPSGGSESSDEPTAGDSEEDTDSAEPSTRDVDEDEASASDNSPAQAEDEREASIDVSQIWPGESVTVSGTGFSPNAQLEVHLTENELGADDNQIDTITTDSDGAFSKAVVIPEDTTPRDYNVQVVDITESGDRYAHSLPLEVLDENDVEVDPSISASPGSGPVGSTISLQGNGYTPLGEIELSMVPVDGSDPITLDSVVADNDGNMGESEIVVPDTAVNGLYSITAVDSRSGEETTADFSVTDVTLEIEPETIPEEEFLLDPAEGGGVTHTVDGLEPGDEVSFNVGNAYNPMEDLSGTAIADENGVAEYVVHNTGDDAFVGSYATTVTLGDDGPQVASGNFEVTSEEPQVSLSEGEVVQGGSVFVSGHNFTPSTDVTLEWEPAGEPLETQVSETGELTYELLVPEDAEPGTYEIVVTDETSGESTTLELTVTGADDETPVVDPEITLDASEAYQGEVIAASGSGFTPNGEVVLGLDSFVASVEADENGEITGESIQVPEDLAAGAQDVTALDVESGEETTTELTVLEAEEPTLRVSPEEIALDEFIRDSEDDDTGVVHTIVGLEPGEEIDAVVEGPEGVATVERDETANEQGIAEFVIYGYDIEEPTNYLGVYDAEISTGDGSSDALRGSFEVVANDDEDEDDGNGDDGESETPGVNPEIALESRDVYPGDSLAVSGSNFTPDGNVSLTWNPTEEATANEDGDLYAELAIPEDTEPGQRTLTVVDQSSGEETTADFTVLDPADQVTEPAMTIDPKEIALDDFVGDPDDGAGVTHTVEGVEPGTEVSYVVTGPENVNDFESSGTVDDNGVAEFVIYGPEMSNPAVFLGDYNTVVTYETQDGETGELHGSFAVVDGSGSGGSGGGDGDGSDGSGSDSQPGPDGESGPVDLNGSDRLADTGASNVQLGLIAGLLLAIGGGFVVFANRGRIFGRKHS